MTDYGDTVGETQVLDAAVVIQEIITANNEVQKRFGIPVGELKWLECGDGQFITGFRCERSNIHYMARIEVVKKCLRIFSHSKNISL